MVVKRLDTEADGRRPCWKYVQYRIFIDWPSKTDQSKLYLVICLLKPLLDNLQIHRYLNFVENLFRFTSTHLDENLRCTQDHF